MSLDTGFVGLSVLTKLLRIVAVVFVITVLTQALLDLAPGSAASVILGQAATAADVAQLNHTLGLDRPFMARYSDWLARTLHGDLGQSPITHEQVAFSISRAAPVTLELVLIAPALALIIAIPLALASASLQGSVFDRVSNGLTSGALAIPSFVAAPVLAYLVAIQLQLLPLQGWAPLSGGLGPNLRNIALPVACIALPEIAIFQRLLRADMIAVLREPYIAAARTRGVPEWRVLLSHALRPASIPLITVVGLSIGRLIGGTVIVETIFALPGLGQLLVSSILSRDLVTVQGEVLVIAVGFVLVNIMVDLAYGIVDPRIRLQAAEQ